MIKILPAILLPTLLLGQFPAMCNVSETVRSGIIYSVHYENGTIINITEDSEKFSEFNRSVMNFLENIANRMERYTGRGILEKELNGTKYLVANFDTPLLIHTKSGLNPDMPQGWVIETRKIIIKLQKEVLGEERIFIYQDGEIGDWSSATSVDTIPIPDPMQNCQ